MAGFYKHPLPNNDDIGYIERVVRQRRYDIIFNFCPFLNQHDLFLRDDKIINFLSVAPIFIGNERILTRLNHVVYQTYQIIHKLLLDFMTPERIEVFKRVIVTLSDSGIKQAETFWQAKVSWEKGVPDSGESRCRYSIQSDPFRTARFYHKTAGTTAIWHSIGSRSHCEGD